jgi:hypothetical protein
MLGIFGKTKESFARKGVFAGCASPFATLFPPPNRKAECREEGPIEIGDFGEAAYTQVNMAKGIFGHFIFRKLGLYLTSYLIFSRSL